MTRSIITLSALVLMTASPALAQSTTSTSSAQTGNSNPAVKDSDPRNTRMAAEGANSFTEEQARERLAKAGYTVSSLAKDAKGVWTGKAMRGGKSMTVGLDYKGNVSAR